MCNHYLIEPTACTPASGWEKGQVENQVGNVREWLFTPKVRCADLARAERSIWRRAACSSPASAIIPSQPNAQSG